MAESRVPTFVVSATGAVTLSNAFSVPAEESDRFLERWKDTARVMSGQPGFVRARMHRSLHNDGEFRFVNVAEWASGDALARAQTNPEWRASVQRMLDAPDLHVTPRPAVYQVVVDLHPGDTL
jgi:heme-degrading monooxygenase HmoA